MKPLTAARAREVLAYDPDTGIATWRITMGNRPAGTAAGTIEAFGYVQVRIDKHFYKLHRVIWLMVTGEWPEADIDHRNQNRADNRWSNLRAASRAQNNANVGKRGTGCASQFKGVFPSCGKWRAQIKLPGGARKSLGRFLSETDAARAYDAAAIEHWGSYARLNLPEGNSDGA